jgi:hypothetical protein
MAINPDPPPLNCPHCGVPLTAARIGLQGRQVVYICLVHERFWTDQAGNLRQDRRKLVRAA